MHHHRVGVGTIPRLGRKEWPIAESAIVPLVVLLGHHLGLYGGEFAACVVQAWGVAAARATQASWLFALINGVVDAGFGVVIVVWLTRCTKRWQFAPSPCVARTPTGVADFLFAARAERSCRRWTSNGRAALDRRFERTIRQDAEWLGLRFDLGAGGGGGRVRQSERMPLYR